ncbi:MAG: CotH kinase family protein, partial [Planctomycetota bacterium]
MHEYSSYEFERDKYGFPPQAKDISYGFYMNEPQYFTPSTPRYANNEGYVGVSEGVWFSPEGGTFADPISLVLTPKTAGAIVRYTLDGSIPTETSAQYIDPIPIGNTTEVQVRVFELGNAHSSVVSQTYVALAPDVRSFNSDIPIVVVDTYGQPINEYDPYTKASAVFIERPAQGGRVNITDSADFAGRCGLKIRGETNKRQFSFETWDEYDQDKRVSIFGLPADSDWVLYGPGIWDRALITNPLAHGLSNQIGQYAVRTRACEVYINTGGGKVAQSDYWGLAYFEEKIRINKDRINIATLEPWDSTEPKVSGGYVIAVDKNGEWKTARGTPHTCCNGAFVYIDPPSHELTSTQKAWLLNWLNEFEDAIYGSNFKDPQIGYAKYIDVDSHINHNLLNMLTMNVDALRLSAYMYKDRQGKLVAGPVWDFDRSLDSTDSRDDNPEAWKGTGDATDYFNWNDWWYRLFDDIDFFQGYIDRWYELRRGPFSSENINFTIDTLANEIEEAQARHYAKWSAYPVRFGSFQGEMDNLKNWLTTRTTWIDNQFVKPPQLTPYGGYVASGSTVTMSNPNGSGTIWYTTDGNDPRLPENLQINSTTLVAEDAIKRVFVPTGPVDPNWKSNPAFDDSGWNDGIFISGKTGGVGYETSTGYEQHISYDVEAKMFNGNNSCYIRIPFTFNGDPCEFNFMTLNIRYDDGFVAYLNGDELERKTFSETATPVWNSNAEGNHEASGLETIPVSEDINSLQQGDNILAIHGLNISNTSTDFLISVELVAGESNSTGGISTSAREYTGPVTLTKSTQIKARVLVDSNPYSRWSGLADPTFGISPVAEDLRITEIMYHPRNTGDANDPNTEFIELRNIGPETLNLNLARFTEGIDFTFPDIELDRDERVVVVKDQSAFEAKYGTSVNMTGPYIGSLANNGEMIKLVDAIGRTILDFEYEDDWCPITDGDGFSLTMIEAIDGDLYGWDEGLTAHWKFDEGSGSIAIDSAGTNNGTLNGDPTWTTGRIDGALSFDGNGDYVEVNDAIVPLAGDSFTAQAWIRVSQSAGIWNPLLVQHDPNNKGYHFYVASSRPSFYIEDSSSVQAVSP